jgi:hypothetical protein
MSQGHLPDLSGLPAEIRQKLETQLAAMTPEMRAHFLKNGLPQLLQRLMKRPAGTGTTTHAPVDIKAAGVEALRQLARRRPHGHYNDTIRPGDHPGSGRWMLYVVFAGFILTLAFR